MSERNQPPQPARERPNDIQKGEGATTVPLRPLAGSNSDGGQLGGGRPAPRTKKEG